jgi:hypothetical protein
MSPSKRRAYNLNYRTCRQTLVFPNLSVKLVGPQDGCASRTSATVGAKRTNVACFTGGGVGDNTSAPSIIPVSHHWNVMLITRLQFSGALKERGGLASWIDAVTVRQQDRNQALGCVKRAKAPGGLLNTLPGQKPSGRRPNPKAAVSAIPVVSVKATARIIALPIAISSTMFGAFRCLAATGHQTDDCNRRKVSDEKRCHRYLQHSPASLERCSSNRRKAVPYVTAEIEAPSF